MPLDRHRQVVLMGRGGAMWMAPLGTPLPEDGEFIGDPWELIDPDVEIPGQLPADVADEP